MDTLQHLAAELQEQWDAFQPDAVASAHLEYPRSSKEVFLAYDAPTELFQALLRLNARAGNAVNISLRFALCNPRSGCEPFLAVMAWLMRRYDLFCQVMSELAPEQSQTSDVIDDPNNLRAILLPSIEYNRRLWQLDAGTETEAALRPGEALACFIAS